MLNRAQEEGGFTLKSFLTNRCYRLLPALLIMMVFFIPISLIVLDPIKIKDLSQSYVSILFLSSNLFFWYKTDYFAFDSIYRPMLHTWSLSVEFQFYVLVGLLSVVKTFKDSSAPRLLIIICLLSLLLSIILDQSFPTARFFFLPLRLYEFIAGALVFFYGKKTRYHFTNNSESTFASVLGLTLLAIATVEFSNDLTALHRSIVATLVTILLLYGAKHKNLVNKFFNLSSMQYFGSISYSLYLYHYPVLSLYRVVGGPDSPITHDMFIIMLIMAISTLSYFYVERTFRARNN